MSEKHMKISDSFEINPTEKTIKMMNPPWPHFWLEVCRGHKVQRPMLLRWMGKKRVFHNRPHEMREPWITAQGLYSFLLEEWTEGNA